MAAQTAADREPPRSECWCCGVRDEPTRMVHLGNHPEVALCLRCAHWTAKRAWEIADQGRHGPFVLLRNNYRKLRSEVVRRGWHHSQLFGGPIRWIGKRLP